MCIILYVLGVSLLTLWTHIHSVQKPSASRPLPLTMEQPGDKRASSASPIANPSQQQTWSGGKAQSKESHLLLKYFLGIS